MTETILLTVPAGPGGTGIVSLVLGGLGSRLELPIDRVDELALAAEAAGASVDGDALELEVTILAERLTLRVGPLQAGTAADPTRRRIIEPLVDGVTVTRDTGREWLQLELSRGTQG